MRKKFSTDKKVWLKPSVTTLSIRKDTFNGSGQTAESQPPHAGNPHVNHPFVPENPTPRGG